MYCWLFLLIEELQNLNMARLSCVFLCVLFICISGLDAKKKVTKEVNIMSPCKLLTFQKEFVNEIC